MYRWVERGGVLRVKQRYLPSCPNIRLLIILFVLRQRIDKQELGASRGKLRLHLITEKARSLIFNMNLFKTNLSQEKSSVNFNSSAAVMNDHVNTLHIRIILTLFGVRYKFKCKRYNQTNKPYRFKPHWRMVS